MIIGYQFCSLKSTKNKTQVTRKATLLKRILAVWTLAQTHHLLWQSSQTQGHQAAIWFSFVQCFNAVIYKWGSYSCRFLEFRESSSFCQSVHPRCCYLICNQPTHWRNEFSALPDLTIWHLHSLRLLISLLGDSQQSEPFFLPLPWNTEFWNLCRE